MLVSQEQMESPKRSLSVSIFQVQKIADGVVCLLVRAPPPEDLAVLQIADDRLKHHGIG